MILRCKAVVVQRKDFRVFLFLSFFLISRDLFSPREILTGDVLSSDIQSEKICDILIEAE